MISTRLAIDIIFIVLIIVAVAITSIVLAKVLTDIFSSRLLVEESGETALVITDPDVNNQPNADNDAVPRPTAPSLPGGSTDESSDLSKMRLEGAGDAQYAASGTSAGGGQFVESVYGSSPVILPITWGAVIGTVIWRGRVRSQWSRQGYDYDTFKLVTKMRGSPTRQRLLDSLREGQKNKLQLAREFSVDWKTIDNHIEMLVQGGLVEEKMVIGTARYYGITKSGNRVLSLLVSSGQTNIRDGKNDSS